MYWYTSTNISIRSISPWLHECLWAEYSTNNNKFWVFPNKTHIVNALTMCTRISITIYHENSHVLIGFGNSIYIGIFCSRSCYLSRLNRIEECICVCKLFLFQLTIDFDSKTEAVSRRCVSRLHPSIHCKSIMHAPNDAGSQCYSTLSSVVRYKSILWHSTVFLSRWRDNWPR